MILRAGFLRWTGEFICCTVFFHPSYLCQTYTDTNQILHNNMLEFVSQDTCDYYTAVMPLCPCCIISTEGAQQSPDWRYPIPSVLPTFCRRCDIRLRLYFWTINTTITWPTRLVAQPFLVCRLTTFTRCTSSTPTCWSVPMFLDILVEISIGSKWVCTRWATRLMKRIPAWEVLMSNS